MNRLLQTAIFVFLYFFCIVVTAQPYPEWEQYVPQGSFITNTKIVDNILYCCSDGGLIKYNIETGETIPFTVYNAGLASNGVSAFDVDSDGNIWLGHFGYGISKLTTESCEILNTSNSGLHNDTIYTICVDQDNKVWIGTQQGIAVLYENNWTYFNEDNSELHNDFIEVIEVDYQNNKWIGGKNGISIFDESEWQVYTLNEKVDYFVDKIAIESDNKAFVSISQFGSGLFQFQDGTFECLNWPGTLYKYITDIEFDLNSNIWLSIWNGNDYGLAMYDGSEFTEYTIGQFGNDCMSLIIDEDNNKWIGTYNNGLIKFNNNIFERIEDGLFSCKSAENIAIENDNSIWFAHHDNLVEFHNGKWIESNNDYYGFHLTNLQEIDINSEGYKWIASEHELIKFDETNWFAFTESNTPLTVDGNYIKDILVDKNDNLWIAEDGLIKYDGNWSSFNTGNSAIHTNDIFCLGMDSGNVLWMGGHTELISFDGQTFHVFDTIGNNIYFDDVQSICIDSVNTKWIGNKNGLITYDNTNWFLYDTLNSELPDNTVTVIQIDKTGNVWVGTENGIGVFKDSAWTVYNATNSSLFGNHIYDIEVSENNTIWISASGGFSRYSQNGFIRVDEYQANKYKGVQINSFPNPFSNLTTIQFKLNSMENGELLVYDITGKKIRTINTGNFLAGDNSYSWDGKNENGKFVKEGIYFCQFTSERFSGTVKLIRY